MILDFVYPAPDCGEPEYRPPVVYKVHYTYFSQMNLVITSLAIVIISLLTSKPDSKQVKLCFVFYHIKSCLKLINFS